MVFKGPGKIRGLFGLIGRKWQGRTGSVVKQLNNNKIPMADKISLVDSIGPYRAAKIFATNRISPDNIVRILNNMRGEFVRVLMIDLRTVSPDLYKNIRPAIIAVNK